MVGKEDLQSAVWPNTTARYLAAFSRAAVVTAPSSEILTSIKCDASIDPVHWRVAAAASRLNRSRRDLINAYAASANKPAATISNEINIISGPMA